ncbi:MAG: hypothetical protein RIB59_12750 [Rhodospirillales bacterium]
MNAETTTPTDIEQEVHNVSAMIAAARQMVAEGQSVDLASLEGTVDAICRLIHDNPPEHSRDIRKALAALVEDLDALEHELTEQHRRLEENLANHTRRLAIEAYSDPADTPATPAEDANGDESPEK